MKNKPEYYTRAGKSNVTLRKFFNNLKDNDLHYENQQITQCVFLGVLRLKPVPTVFSSNNTPPGCSAEADNKPRRFRNNNSNKEVNKNLSRKKNINKVISGKIRKKNPEKIKASVKKVPVKKNIIKIKLNMKKKQSTTPPEQTPTDSPSDLTPSLSLEPVTSSPTFNPVVNLFNKLKQQIESKHNLPGPSGLLDSTKDCAKPQQHTPSVFELNTNKQPPAKAKKAKKSGKKRSIIFERLAMPLLPASHDVKFGTDSSGCKEDSLSSLTSNLSNSSIDEQDIANKPTESVAVGQEVPKITKQKERTSPRNKLPTSKMLCDDEVYCLNDEAAIVQDTPEITVNDVIIIPDIVAEEPSKDSSQNDVIVIDEPKGPRLSPRTRQLQEQKEESPITNLSREPKENASVDTSADTGENRKSNCSETANTSNNSDSLEKPRRRRRLMPTAIPSIFFNTPMLLRSELAQKKSDAPEKKTNPRGSSRLLRSEPNRQEKTQKGRKSTSLERFQSSNEDAQSKNYEENENLIYEVVKPAASATTQSLSLPESLTSTSNEVICLDEASPKVEPLIIKLKVSQQRNSETSPKKNHVSHENQAKEESEKQKNVELAKKNISPKKSRVKPLPEANVSTEMKRLFPQDKSSEISLSVDLSNPSPVKNAPPKKSVEKDSTKLEENVSKSQTAVKSTSLKKSIAKVPSKAIEIDLVEDTDVAKKKNNNNEEGVQLKGSSNPRSKTGKKIQENVVEDVILIPDDNQSNVMILSNQTNELPLKKSAEAPKKSKQSNQLLQKNIENENDTAAIDVDSEDNEEKYVKVLPETMEICSRSERNEKTFSDVQKQITVHSDLRLDIKSDTDIKSDAEEKSDVEIVEFVPKMTRSAIARGNKTKSKGDTSQDGQSNEKSDPKETSEVEIVGFIPKMTRNTVVKENATKMNKDTKPESEEKSEVEVVELTPEMSRSTVAKESGTKTNPHTSKGSQVNPKSDVEIIEFVPKMTRSALAKENETKMNMNDNQTDTKPDSEEKSDLEIIEFVPKMTRSALAKENETKINMKDNQTDTKPDSEVKSDVEIVEIVPKMTRSALAKENGTKMNIKDNETDTKPDSEEKSDVEIVEFVPKITRSALAKENGTKMSMKDNQTDTKPDSEEKSDVEIVEFVQKMTRSALAKENETKINMKGNQTNTKPDSEEKSEVEVVEIVPKMTRSSVAKDNATKTNVETSRAKSDMEIVEFIPKKTRSSVAKENLSKKNMDTSKDSQKDINPSIKKIEVEVVEHAPKMHESTVAEENAIKINMDKPKTQSVQEKNVKIEDLDDVCFVSEVIAETNESRRTLRSGPSQKKNVPAEKKSESSAIGSDHKKTNDCDSPPPRQLRSDKGQQKSLEGKNNVPETKKRPSKSPKVDNKSTNKNKSVNVDEKYTEDGKKDNHVEASSKKEDKAPKTSRSRSSTGQKVQKKQENLDEIIVISETKTRKSRERNSSRMLRSSLVEPLPISEPPETKPVIEKVVVLIHDEPKTKQNKISLDESEDIDEAICEEEKITPPRSLRSQKLNETISGDINTEKGKVQEKCAKKKSDVQKDRPKAVAKAAIKGKRPILKIHQLKGGKMKQRKNIKPSRSLRSGVKTEKTKNKLEKTKKMKQKLSQPVKKLKRRAAASVSKKESLASKRRAVKLRKTAIVKNKKASKKEKPVDIIENIIQEIRNTLFKGNCEEQELQIKEENSPKENVSPGTKKPVKRLKMSEAPNRKKKARRASLKEIKNFKNTKSNAAETKQGNKRVENAKKRKAVDKKTSEITRRESRRVADKKTVKTEEDSASTNPNPNEIVKPGLSEEKLEQGKTIVQSKNQESVSKETMKENNHDAKVEVHSRKEIYQMVNSYLEEINDESHGDKLKRKSEEHSVDAKRQCKKKMLSKSVPVPEVVQAVPTKTIVSSDVKSIAREIKEETAIVVKEQVQSMEIPEDFPENSDPMSVEELEILRQTLQGIEAKRQTTKTFNRFVFIVNEMLRNEQSSSNLMSLDNQDKESKEPVLPEYAGVKGYQNYRAQDVVNLVDGKFDKKGLRVVNTMNTLIPSREVVGTIKQQCPVNNRIESAIISLKPVDITPAEIPAPPERLERRTDITVFDFDESEPEITPLRHKVSPIVDKSSSPTKALPWSSTEPQEKKPPKEKVKTERVRRNKATPVAPETGTVIDLDGTKRKLWSRIENPVPTDMKPPPPPPPRSEPGRNQEVVEEPPNSPTKATSPMKQPTIIEMFKMVRLKMECPGTSAVSGSGVDEGPVVSRDGSVVNLKRQVFGEAMPPPLKPEKLNYKAEGLEDEDSDCESRAEWVPEEYAEYKMKYSAQKMMRVKQIHQCKFCMKIYPTYYQLVKHKREHEKTENPYMCPECQAVFNNVEDFSAHLRGHRGKYPYTCHKCDLGFWTKSAFDAHKPIHILRKMKPSPKKFRCDICAKEFAKLCDIDRHSRVHTGEKPFVCNICNKRFQQAHNLSKHLLIHLHLKPFQCEICNKQFGRIDVLTRHLLTHSLDKPFKCSVCGKSFIRQLQLNQHREKRHPSEPPKTEPPEGLRDGGGGAAREVRGVEAQ